MKFYYSILVLFCMTAVSCRTVRQITERKAVPLTTENRLLKNIESHLLDFNTLYVKRADVSFFNNGKSSNFKASLKIKRDEFIQVSLTAPLGIEVARILLTPDSIKFADIYHKEYFLADYGYFYDKFDVNLSFGCIQKILTNTFCNIDDCIGEGKAKKYKLDRTEQGYELSTMEERALSRKIKKFYKKKRKDKDFILILQKILVDPEYFRPMFMSLEDVEENMGVSVEYRDLKEFSGKLFPERMSFGMFSEQKETNLNIRFLKLEFDVPVEANFRISARYKRMN